MNIRNARLAYKLASHFYGRYRDLNNEQKRNVYEALRVLASPESSGADGEPFDTARLQAGEVTRSAHDRLDARRAQFRAAQVEKATAKQLEKEAKKEKNKKNAARIGASAGILTVLAAIAGAVYYFFFRDEAPAANTTKTAKQPAKPAQQKKESNTVTVIRPTSSGQETTAPSHGPLSEEPAERDEQLLSSIDEQLSTLDTLDDEQRQATKPRHND